MHLGGRRVRERHVTFPCYLSTPRCVSLSNTNTQIIIKVRIFNRLLFTSVLLLLFILFYHHVGSSAHFTSPSSTAAEIQFSNSRSGSTASNSRQTGKIVCCWLPSMAQLQLTAAIANAKKFRRNSSKSERGIDEGPPRGTHWGRRTCQPAVMPNGTVYFAKNKYSKLSTCGANTGSPSVNCFKCCTCCVYHQRTFDFEN